MLEINSDSNVLSNDEPTSKDSLDRDKYAEAFVRLSENTKGPLVVGLYGTWGSGKTSLMKLIEKKLNAKKAHAIWFNLWVHQFDEHPAVAMAQKLVETLELKNREKAKKLVTIIAAALGSRLLQFTTGMKILEVLKLGRTYEEERFQIRSDRLRLREHFESLVKIAKGVGRESKRLVFFIDDLDRCMPDRALELLEALKLYLNMEHCVYFLAVDRHALMQSIKHRYENLQMNEVEYLDKIIQVPFTVPPVEPKCMDSFVETLLSKELQSCRELLRESVGDNPRQVKRFINILKLNHQLAKPKISGYKPEVLALLLIIQLLTPELYYKIVSQPNLLIKLVQEAEETQGLFDKFLATRERLRNALKQGYCPGGDDLKNYIYLTEAAGIVKEVGPEVPRINLVAVLEKHERWVTTDGKQGERADLRGANLSEIYLRKANLRGADLTNVNLTGAKLGGAVLNLADLCEANLNEADLSRADLTGAYLLRAKGLTRHQIEQAIIDEDTQLPDYIRANEEFVPKKNDP